MRARTILFGAGLLGTAAGLASTGRLALALDVPERNPAIEASVHYSGCDQVRALGKAPLYAGQPGYREGMDGDSDGIACEPHRDW